MLLRFVKDTSGASGDIGTNTSAPFTAKSFLDPLVYTVFDDTTVVGTTGQALVLSAGATDSIGGSFVVSATATQAIGRGHVGIVRTPAAQTGGQATIIVEGPAKAFVTSTANTNKAIAVGDPLTLSGAGNLTSSAANPGTAGTVVAFAGAALAGGVSTPTLLQVFVGGY